MIKITVNEYVGDSSQDFNLECGSLTEALTIMAQYYENRYGAEKCEDSENMAQESVETSNIDGIDWSQAPEWATMYGKTEDDHFIYYDYDKYTYASNWNTADYFTFDEGVHNLEEITPTGMREL